MALGMGLGLVKKRAAVASFDPTSLDWVGLYDHESARYQDTAGTTPVSADAQDVKRWDDRNGSLNITEATNNPASLTVSGTPVVSFVRDPNDYLGASWSPGTLTDFSVHAICKRQNNNFNSLSTFNSPGGTTVLGVPWTTGVIKFGNPAQFTSEWLVYGSSQYHHIAVTREGTDLKFYIDGALVEESTYSATLTPNLIRLGASSASGGGLDVAMFGVSTSVHTPEEIASIHAHYRSEMAAFAAQSVGCIWMSNSLGTPSFAGVTSGIVQKVHGDGNDYTTSVNDVWNGSVGGKTTPEMLADWEMRISPLIDIPSQAVVVIWEGTNDINQNAVTGDEAADNLFDLCDAIKTAHPTVKIVLVTVIDRTGLTRSDIDDCNDALIAGWASHADALADLTSVTNISGDGAAENLTYFVDGTHLTDPGNELAAPVIGAAVESALAS